MNPQRYQEFSLCLRFKTPHFNLEVTDDDMMSPVYGSVVSLTSMAVPSANALRKDRSPNLLRRALSSTSATTAHISGDNGHPCLICAANSLSAAIPTYCAIQR